MTTASAVPRASSPATRTPDADTCCERFDPAPWDGTTHVWKDRLFLQHELRQILHVPIGVARAVTAMTQAATRAGAMPPRKEVVLLFSETSAWKGMVHLPVTRELPGETTVRLSGTFVTKVFDGPYRDVPKWLAATAQVLATRGQRARQYYVHYAYCPKCARKYGHNHGVVFAQVA